MMHDFPTPSPTIHRSPEQKAAGKSVKNRNGYAAQLMREFMARGLRADDAAKILKINRVRFRWNDLTMDQLKQIRNEIRSKP